MEKMKESENKLDAIISMIKKELDFATSKFGIFHNTHEGYGVMKEEFDEMWDRIKQNSNLCFEECVQLAAMSIRFIYDLADKQSLARVQSAIGDRLWNERRKKEKEK